MKVFIVIFLVALKHDIGFAATAASNTDWNYEDQDSWPGQCTTGKQQSPINIETTKAVLDIHGAHVRGPLQFSGYDSVRLLAENQGRTLEWTLDSDWPAPMVWGGPLRGNYTFEQFHLHWLSEHAIDGRKYPLEIHFVHVKAGLTLEQAVQQPDGVAVIATLCEVHISAKGRSAPAAQFALEEIMHQVPYLLEYTGEHLPPTIIEVKRMFSPRPQSYYTYLGSLTTPECLEVVTWIVMDTPIIIADTQLRIIHKTDIGGDSDNFRQLQPLLNRVVYKSSGSVFSPNILILLTTSLAWLAAELKKGICAVINKKKLYFGKVGKKCMEITINYDLKD